MNEVNVQEQIAVLALTALMEVVKGQIVALVQDAEAVVVQEIIAVRERIVV